MSSPSFSSIYERVDGDVRGILSRVRCPTPARVEELLEASRVTLLGLIELAELLEIGVAPEAEEQFAMLRAAVESRWRKPEGNELRYIAPIYVSSHCIDTCAYCNFSASRKATVRKRLSIDELDAEIDAVMSRGARVIELVYATDPECTPDLLVRHVERTYAALKGEPGSGVFLCTEYLSLDTYRALRAAGLRGIVQWDETLDQHEYQHWHATSPHKREFLLRMDNHDRAMQAGLEVATGALFGLADFRYDALLQLAKAHHFLREYGRGPFVLGTARLKPIGGHDLKLKTIVDDRAYETALMVYRIALPDTGRWLQTREAFEMNLRNMLDGDVFTYRCGEVTPGGYHKIEASAPATKGGQFGVNELELDYVDRELAGRNFRINYTWLDPERVPVA